MASAPNVVALIVVTVDKQRHAVATSQQLVGCSQSYTSLNVASIDNQAVEAVIDRRDRGTVSAAAADDQGITLSYEEKQAVEGKKKKQLVKVTRSYPFDQIKYTKEWLDFK